MLNGKKKSNLLVTANTELQEEFCRLRELCWISQGKQLPALGEVILGYGIRLDNGGCYGWIHRTKKIRTFIIALDWELCQADPVERRRTLLEEMTHLWMRRKRDKGNSGHGGKFQRELDRVTAIMAVQDML